MARGERRRWGAVHHSPCGRYSCTNVGSESGQGDGSQFRIRHLQPADTPKELFACMRLAVTFRSSPRPPPTPPLWHPHVNNPRPRESCAHSPAGGPPGLSWNRGPQSPGQASQAVPPGGPVPPSARPDPPPPNQGAPRRALTPPLRRRAPPRACPVGPAASLPRPPRPPPATPAPPPPTFSLFPSPGPKAGSARKSARPGPTAPTVGCVVASAGGSVGGGGGGVRAEARGGGSVAAQAGDRPAGRKRVAL